MSGICGGGGMSEGSSRTKAGTLQMSVLGKEMLERGNSGANNDHRRSVMSLAPLRFVNVNSFRPCNSPRGRYRYYLYSTEVQKTLRTRHGDMAGR